MATTRLSLSGDSGRPSPRPSVANLSKPSARSYVEAAMAEGLSGEKLATEVLRVIDRLEDDLPVLDWVEREHCASYAQEHQIYGKRQENIYLRYRIGKCQRQMSEAGLTRSFSNINNLDGDQDANVTGDWKKFLQVRGESWYQGLRTKLAAAYVSACYPLDFDDLCSEIDIAAALALAEYRGVPTRIAVLKGHGAPRLSTFLKVVMENRLRDLADASRRRPPASLESGIDRLTTEHADASEAVVDRLAVREALCGIADADLIVSQLAGYHDAELGRGNVRMKRSRALRRLAERLEGWFD